MRQNKSTTFYIGGSDKRFSKILLIRTGSDSILSDQDWTRTEKFHSPLISGAHGVKSQISQIMISLDNRSGNFSNLRIRLLFRLRLPSIQPGI